MKNEKNRIALLLNKVKVWELTKILGVSETTVTRRLRDELPEPEQERICKLIEEYAKKRSSEQ